MFYLNEEEAKRYDYLMSQFKNINSDWISLRNSRQYKTGLVLCEVIDDIKKFDFHKLWKHSRRWLRGAKSRRIGKATKISTAAVSPNYFHSERIAIYTAVFGDYDKIPEPYCVPDNCDFYIFTDQEIPKESIWKKKDVPAEICKMANAKKNRFLKMHPDTVFPDYNYSVYVDGNICIISDLTEYVNRLGKSGIGIHLHNYRSCIYEELESVVKTGRMTKEEARKVIAYAEENSMPRNYGLLQCSVIVREHRNPVCKKVMEDWWNLYCTFGKRDQLYLPIVLFQQDLKTSDVGVMGNDLYSNPSFRVLTHNL